MSETTNRFAIDLEEMAEERILIPAGVYPAKISKAEISHGVPKSGDGYWYRIDTVLDIKDQGVIELLKIDTPKVFYQLMVSTEKDSEIISKTNNPDLGALLKACGLKTKEASEVFMEAAETATTQRDWNLAYLKKMCDALPGSALIAVVVQRKHGTDPDRMVNAVTKVAAPEA